MEGVFKEGMCGDEATGIKGPLQPFTTRSSPRAPPDMLIIIITALCSLFALKIKKIKEEEKDDEVPLDTRIRWLIQTNAFCAGFRNEFMHNTFRGHNVSA